MARTPPLNPLASIIPKSSGRLPPLANPYTGLAIATAATSAAVRRPAPTEHAVARDPNPPVRPAAPTGQLASVTTPAERMEIHVVDDVALAARDEGRFSTWIEAQFNPEKILETVEVAWNDLVVPNLSHERRHYSHTKSVPFQFDLSFDGYEFLETDQQDPFEKPGVSAGAEYIDAVVRFLRSLEFPDATTGSPPRCLFYWPNFISLTATVDKIVFEHRDWAPSGHLMRFGAAISLKEIRDRHMSRDDVLLAGNRRTSPPAGTVG